MLFSACATPVPPTGGPADQTPPVIVSSTPTADAVNVEGSRLQIRFSEYVDLASFQRAFSISPAMDGEVDFGWSGRTVTIDLPEPLRSNTTYVVTLDNNLRDARGVALRQPVVLAFSTGPTINRGRLSGLVRDPLDGDPVPGFDVFAYALTDTTAPQSLPARPGYRTQTGPDGRFTFEYLSEEPFFVLALGDQNRNRMQDPQEPFAVPFRPVLFADSAGVETGLPWLVTRSDTAAPVPDRVRSLSDRRIEIRFTEPVALQNTDPQAWALQDSLTGSNIPVRAIYSLSAMSRLMFALTDPLQAEAIYRIRPGAVADSAGNLAPPVFRSFTAVGQPDTVRLRFVGYVPDSAYAVIDSVYVLWPEQPFGVRFNQPVASETLNAAVSLRDSSNNTVSFTFQSPDGTAYLLTPAEPLEQGQPMHIRIDNRLLGGADTVYTRAYRYPAANELGEMSGYVAAPDATDRIIVELYPSGQNVPLRVLQTEPSGRFYFGLLPERTYRIRAFIDRDGDLRWDGGRIQPYIPPEAVVWSSDSLRVRPRWETAFPDTLRIAPLE
jgi:hypothetical protein